MRIEANKQYRFTKSGNLVRTLERSGTYHGVPLWTVERTDGESAGKQMQAPASALAPPDA